MLDRLQGEISYWYKAVSATNASLWLGVVPMSAEPWENTGAPRTGSEIPVAHVGDGQWHRVSVSYDYTQQPKVKWVHVSCFIRGDAAELLLDDIECAGAGPQPITNGSFEDLSPDRDGTREVTELCHQHGMRYVPYYWAQRETPAVGQTHPDWRCRNSAGKPTALLLHEHALPRPRAEPDRRTGQGHRRGRHLLRHVPRAQGRMLLRCLQSEVPRAHRPGPARQGRFRQPALAAMGGLQVPQHRRGAAGFQSGDQGGQSRGGAGCEHVERLGLREWAQHAQLDSRRRERGRPAGGNRLVRHRRSVVLRLPRAPQLHELAPGRPVPGQAGLDVGRARRWRAGCRSARWRRGSAWPR